MNVATALKLTYQSSTKKWTVLGLKGLFSLAMAGGALANVTGQSMMIENLQKMGYPPFLATILGVAYLIGLIALWQTKSIFLREWSVAGFCIALIGAVLSHNFTGQPFAESLPALVLLGLLLTAYALEKNGGSHEN